MSHKQELQFQKESADIMKQFFDENQKFLKTYNVTSFTTYIRIAYLELYMSRV